MNNYIKNKKNYKLAQGSLRGGGGGGGGEEEEEERIQNCSREPARRALPHIRTKSPTKRPTKRPTKEQKSPTK
jgi:hypothetical protein